MTFPEKLPSISIITLNYNQTAVTCAFLESSRSLQYPDYEILVCDMASTEDPTPQILAGNYPHTRVLCSPVNLGFAAGNNWGMQHARGEYFFIVNNDTELNPTLLSTLIGVLLKNPSIGAVSPKIRYFSNPSIIQYAGFNPMHAITGRTSSIGFGEVDQGQYDSGRETAAVHGCAMLVPRSVCTIAGRFPERFFLYYEEWDWSARIKKAGFKLWYEGSAYILHKDSISVGKTNPMKVYYHTRNRILYMRRNADRINLSLFWLYFLTIALPAAIIQYLAKGELSAARNFLKGLVWNFRHTASSVI